MLGTLSEYSDLKKSKLTWVDSNGTRCMADFCYRTKELSKGVSEVVCVVTERADNPGMSITNSANAVVEAVCSRFPVRDKLLITERYDSRSYAQAMAGERLPRYAQMARPDARAGVIFKPVPPPIAEFLSLGWNDCEEVG